MATLAPHVLTAFNRFGLGPKFGDFARMKGPRGALLAELAAPQGAVIDDPALVRTPEILQAVYADQDLKKMQS